LDYQPAFLTDLRHFFEVRFFRLVYDPAGGNFAPVRWVEKTFAPKNVWGHGWEIEFTLETYAGAEVLTD
jgi:hypothetical protein